MFKRTALIVSAIAAMALLPMPGAVGSDKDHEFFRSLAGQWSGPGEIVAGKYKGTKFICDFKGDTPGSSVGVTLDGSCRVGVFTQKMQASIERRGRVYRGKFLDGAKGKPLDVHTEYYAARGATLVTVIAADHPGLFYRIAGGIHLAGGNIIDARIHTTRDGTAVDNFLVQDPLGRPFSEESQLARIESTIADALANRVKLVPQLAARPLARPRADAFAVEPRVEFDNAASNRFTVVEVNARDRPALLNRLARALFEAKLMVHSAHIATYGERAADTFYVTDLLGEKVDAPQRLKAVEKKLLEAAGEETIEVAAA